MQRGKTLCIFFAKKTITVVSEKRKTVIKAGIKKPVTEKNMKKNLLTMQPYFVFGTEKFIQYRCFHNGISHLYAFGVSQEKNRSCMIIPDGCVNVLFGYDENGMSAKVYVTARSPQIFTPDKKEYFGIRIYQDEFASRMRCAPQEIADATADIDAIPVIKAYRDQLSEAKSFEKRVKILNAFTGNSDPIFPEPKEVLLQGMKSYIAEKQGMESISEIAEEFHFSKRYINHIFQEKMALSAKEYSEIVRFQRILFRIKEKKYTTLTDLAIEEGYYDQAHFTRNFRENMCMNPLEYVRQLRATGFQDKIREM